MLHSKYMDEKDRAEWQEIEATVEDALKRRSRLLNRLRQRAYRDRNKPCQC